MGERGGGEGGCQGQKENKGGESENNQNVFCKCVKVSKEQDLAVVRHGGETRRMPVKGGEIKTKGTSLKHFEVQANSIWLEVYEDRVTLTRRSLLGDYQLHFSVALPVPWKEADQSAAEQLLSQSLDYNVRGC